MASTVNMSLEDIIKKKKKPQNTRSKRTYNNNAKAKPKNTFKNGEVMDARLKIISKKRTQITDAREKLAELAKQKDARLKLEQLRRKRALVAAQSGGRNTVQNFGHFKRTIPNNDRVFIDRSRQVVSQPLQTNRKLDRRNQINTKKFLENRFVEAKSLRTKVTPKPILRTVENDIEIIDDPMEGEYIPPKSNTLIRKANLQLKIIAHNNDVREGRSQTIHRTLVHEKAKSPPRPPSILKKRPMASSRIEKKIDSNEKPNLEYRIIVSNLRNTVTGGDIEELFGDVGGMVESRLVRPGTAEVIYKTVEDAQRAVDLYHNRQLDGQPMNCLLVTPRSNFPAPSRSSSIPALYSTNSNVEPDISTFHKVLFSNF